MIPIGNRKIFIPNIRLRRVMESFHIINGGYNIEDDPSISNEEFLDRLDFLKSKLSPKNIVIPFHIYASIGL